MAKLAPALRIDSWFLARQVRCYFDKMGEFLTSPFFFSSFMKIAKDLFPEVVEELDVKGRVHLPIAGEGSTRPIRGGVLLK